MLISVDFVTKILSFFTVIADIMASVIIFVLLVKKFGKPNEFINVVIEFLGSNAVLGAFIIVLTSITGSIFYSEIAGFLPCSLCWWQRVFLYPQVILFGIALWKKERVADYAIALSSVGALIASYHSYLQFGGLPLIPCAASAAAASCAQRYFLEFGYVTIPTMSLTVFILIILLMLTNKSR